MSGLFYHDTVRVLRPQLKQNRAGDTTPDYNALRTAALADPSLGVARENVQVRPTASDGRSEIIRDDRDTTFSEWRISTAAGTGDWDVQANDWIRLPDGTITQVYGRPARPTDPVGGALHHVQVLVREVAD